MVLAQRDAELQQRIIAATLLADPELKIANAMFNEEASNPKMEQTHDGLIFYPSSSEEYEDMLKLFEEMDDQTRLNG